MNRLEIEPAQALTINKLEHKEDVTTNDVWNTLRSYAESGYSIRGSVITDAIDKCEANGLDLEDILEAATIGVVELERNRLHSSIETVRCEQAEYAHVIGHVSLLLEAREE